MTDLVYGGKMSNPNTMPTVLVADDNVQLVGLIVGHLRSKGYRVIEALDGEKAFEQILEEKPDLILLDVMMPRMSGWEVCRRIRESEEISHIPVIMLTGIGEKLNEMTSPLYGADDYIDKPFELATLDEKIQAILPHDKGVLKK